MSHDGGHGHGPVGKLEFALKCLNCLGVVYGDIGTSPLYVFKSIFHEPPAEEDVYGALCLVLWSITLVVTIKYLIFILQCDFKGEGGMFALLSLLLYDPTKDEDITANPHLLDIPTADEEAEQKLEESGGTVPIGQSGSGHTNGEQDPAVKLEDEIFEEALRLQEQGKADLESVKPNVGLDDIEESPEVSIPVVVNPETSPSPKKKKGIKAFGEGLKSLLLENPLKLPKKAIELMNQEMNKLLERFESLKRLHRSPFLEKKAVGSTLSMMAIIAASLLLGDGITTPSISVISAMEGLILFGDAFEKAIIPATIAILLFLFWAQRFGTAKVGAIFGPIMLIWFATLMISGIYNFTKAPHIARAFNPMEGLNFFIRKKYVGWTLLGSVVLCITGGEAMFADMGHFGKWPVRVTWMSIVYPSIVCNYLGQGAMLLKNPEYIDDPFFHLVPKVTLIPTLILATFATVIASQALISGAFSIVQQAISMKIFPKVKIIHTSTTTEGQIYIPVLNYMLGTMCILLVLIFQSSARLGSLYGLAVCGDMTFTTIFFAILTRLRWRWHIIPWFFLILQMMIVDLAFLSAATLKIPSGAWFTLAFGSIVFTLMFVWRWGKREVQQKLHSHHVTFDQLKMAIADNNFVRTDRVAVYLSSVSNGVPFTLTEMVEHARVLHRTIIFLTVKTAHVPFVPEKQRKHLIKLSVDGFYRVICNVGYRETDFDIQKMIMSLSEEIPDLQTVKVSFFVGIENVVVNPQHNFLKKGLLSLFNLLLSISYNSSAEFNLPSASTVSIGQDIVI